MADNLYAIGVDVPPSSVLSPFKGTPLYEQMAGDGRMLPERGSESTTATTSRSGRGP